MQEEGHNKVDETELGPLYSLRKQVASQLTELTGLNVSQLMW